MGFFAVFSTPGPQARISWARARSESPPPLLFRPPWPRPGAIIASAIRMALFMEPYRELRTVLCHLRQMRPWSLITLQLARYPSPPASSREILKSEDCALHNEALPPCHPGLEPGAIPGTGRNRYWIVVPPDASRDGSRLRADMTSRFVGHGATKSPPPTDRLPSGSTRG